MRPRPKGPQFSADESKMIHSSIPFFFFILTNYRTVRAFLVGFGDDHDPLGDTIRILDEIATDYIIEACHEAEMHARHAGRAKIKVDDFQFALRGDAKKLGRVQELLDMEKRIKRDRQAFNTDEGKVTREAKNGGNAAAGGAGAGGAAGGGDDGERKAKRRKKKQDKDNAAASAAASANASTAAGAAESELDGAESLVSDAVGKKKGSAGPDITADKSATPQ
jgi:transcription initiation factor TFIID subunit 13